MHGSILPLLAALRQSPARGAWAGCLITVFNVTPNQTMFRLSCNAQGIPQVFVRAVWRQQRLVDVRPNLREIGAPPKRNVDVLGVSVADFPRLTRGLFDRQP